MLQVIVAADIFPKIYLLLRDSDPMVRRNAAIVVREVCKHTIELAQLVVATGGVAALVDNIRETSGNERLPGQIWINHYLFNYNFNSINKLISVKCSEIYTIKQLFFYHNFKSKHYIIKKYF